VYHVKLQVVGPKLGEKAREEESASGESARGRPRATRGEGHHEREEEKTERENNRGIE